MVKSLKIGNNEFSFSNSVWTLKVYKDIFKRDWHTDRNAQLADSIKAIKFQQEYADLTDEQFNKLPKEKQDAYWQGLKENKVDLDFTLDTIYAMAISGGYNGTQKDFLTEIPSSELNADSELMKLAEQFVSDFSPELKTDVKKKVK